MISSSMVLIGVSVKMLTVHHGLPESASETSQDERERERNVYFSDESRTRGARRMSISMDIYRPELYDFDESKLGYYIPDWEDLVHIPDKREGEIHTDKEDLRKLQAAMEEGAHWIIIQGGKFQSIPLRYITYSKRAHLFGTGCGILSILMSQRWPRSYMLYIPLTIASVGGAFYYYYYSQRPISQYMVEKNKVQLARFPMAKFAKHTMVLKKIPPSQLVIARNFVIAFFSVYSMISALVTPSPPCICKWKVLDLLREQELAKVRAQYSPENNI